MCVGVWEYVHMSECSYPQSPAEGAGFPGAGIAGGYGLPDMG